MGSIRKKKEHFIQNYKLEKNIIFLLKKPHPK